MRPRFSAREDTAIVNRDACERLPADHAFVLQFEANCGAGGGARGRVEHVVSGRASRFQSIDELATFLAAVLRDVAANAGEAK
jgi:hypothetical protein